MEPNFKCTETGARIYIPNTRSKIVNGEVQYFYGDRWERLRHPQTGHLVIKIENGIIPVPGIRTPTKNR